MLMPQLLNVTTYLQLPYLLTRGWGADLQAYKAGNLTTTVLSHVYDLIVLVGFGRKSRKK